MNTIHWLGAGLSSVPGIRRLATTDTPFVLWNRTLSKAVAALEGTGGQPKVLNWAALDAVIQPGDVLVSMLPADQHLRAAELCLDHGSHFVCSSYVSPGMQTLDAKAREKGCCMVNEVGLDPGIDHLMAHALMAEYENAGCMDPALEHRFTSYCGGFPGQANDFRYKFSWSPLGVLKALKTPACWIDKGMVVSTGTPWKALTTHTAQLPSGEESFQAYPNRDSLPFAAAYGFGPGFNMKQFVRGTLRLDGWAEAWRSIFDMVDQSIADDDDARLVELSQELWASYAYTPGEADRVVLQVALDVRSGETPIWSGTYTLDEYGNDEGSAMARLVSKTVAIAVESVRAGTMPTGVSTAPSDPATARAWIDALIQSGEGITRL